MNARNFCTLAVLLALAGSARASVIEVIALRDATIYNDPTASAIANSAGQHFFAGMNGENNNYAIRRALLYFDLASELPGGVIITSAELRVYANRGIQSASFWLHPALAPWGQGTSDPSGPEGSGTGATANDPTWAHNFYATSFWANAGGDFSASASATLTIGSIGFHLFSSPAMVADAQAWYDAPGSNYGWFLVGDETLAQSPWRFSSTESGDDTAPTLILGYAIVPEPRGLLAAGALALLFSNRWKNRRKKFQRLERSVTPRVGPPPQA